MKNFISIFIISLVVCWIATIFFVGFIINNIWAIIIVVAFLLTVLITAYINQESRIEELERKMEQVLNNKQD